ncbi:DUF2309 domain-containing protein [Flavobacterium sp. M31R6]|uniref:DUF2309 domain-containing protein n=1 Tax=Flavobacterium sp. M31R6 TaxID=2739062 RepID=UPI0015690F45|nr:DUF2309 domain-containing protein [Flavobacterium sp. M31R6]QKJ61667.1 DUF2309 domain-containing protein [Flavobacterium sp. M31R6]
MENPIIQKCIAEASQVIGKTWPLYSFVTSNPLAGYEQMPFEEAVKQAEKLLDANVYPEAAFFRQAWKKGEINEKILRNLLAENQLLASPEEYLLQMELYKKTVQINSNNNLDCILAKWLAAFLDEGLAEWEMPNKSEGFYRAWRKLAVYDTYMPKTALAEIPKTSIEVLNELLNKYGEKQFIAICTFHLASLPGWTGYINHRTDSNSQWQEVYPINIQDYLGVRLWIAQKIKAVIEPEKSSFLVNSSTTKLHYIWLKAWEKSFQSGLVKLLGNQQISTSESQTKKQIPDAQLVFCIDTRSELIRRNIENKGNYETFGYAGFFGIAMDYENLNNGIIHKACPPIVNSAYKVSEVAPKGNVAKLQAYQKKNQILNFKEYFLKRMKNMLPSAFGYVEGSGFFYGISLIARTIAPAYLYRITQKGAQGHESICTPEIKKRCNHNEDSEPNISLTEKAAIVKSAFDIMGWQEFAPIIVFIGHGSHSANNAFGSSLDCGACAASPGRNNARMLAKLANLPEVRKTLLENHNILIPGTTTFIGGEHNTTTDEIVLFDAETPDLHKKWVEKLKFNLAKAQLTATQERLGIKTEDSVKQAQKKANDWGETRPEWGLAKNAGFIIGPRNLTKNHNLDGRCFLNSYNWETDAGGSALENIMQGPMTVTQWINNHYYFSTVDNEVFGGGSKITHNITGKFAVVQGNGGDIKMGLPLQSLRQSDKEMYHQPLRLSVIIQAPLTRVTEIVSRNENIKRLLDNQWIYLMVMNPLEENTIYQYQKNLNWNLASKRNKAKKEAGVFSV